MSEVKDEQKVKALKPEIEYIFDCLYAYQKNMERFILPEKANWHSSFTNKLIFDSFQLFINCLYDVLSPKHTKKYNSVFSCITISHFARMLIEQTTLLHSFIEQDDSKVGEYVFLRNAIFEYRRIKDQNNHKKREDKCHIPDDLTKRLCPYLNKTGCPIQDKLDVEFFGKELTLLIEEKLWDFHLIWEECTVDAKKAETKWSLKILHEAVHGAIYLVEGNVRCLPEKSEYADSLRVLETVHISLYYILIATVRYCELLKRICDPNVFSRFTSAIDESREQIKEKHSKLISS
tara:strand:+ start:123 stop:995 length:873 start_codon:yes stop_codon:yes gene_type:complete